MQKLRIHKTMLLALGLMMFAQGARAQERALLNIAGTVRDDNQMPLIGASVVIKGTTTGLITGSLGDYSIDAPQDATLVFSFMGMTTVEETVGGRPRIDVVLATQEHLLEAVVAIGYGTQTKKEITGSVSSIKVDDFNKGMQLNPMGLIQGKVAGLTIIKNGGDDPAQNSYQVQLRGVGSLKGNDAPLYIIDGVPGGDLSSVLPGDIEAIDVLKDGSAAAIYGTRANHGVILITTKRGKAGQAAVEYSGDVATGFIARRPRVLTADEYRANMVDKGRGIDYGGNTNWLDQIVRTPVSHTHALAITGGSETFNYRGSVGYRNMQGVALKSDYDEINGRFAANQRALGNRLKLSYDFSYTTANRNWADYEVFNQAVRLNPTKPVHSADPQYDKYGHYFEDNAFYTNNALAMVNEKQNAQRDKVLLGSLRAAFDLTHHLQFSTFYSIQQKSVWNGVYENRFYREIIGQSENGKANQDLTEEQMQVIENILQYTKHFSRHSLQAVAGQSYQYSQFMGFGGMNTNFPLDDILYNNLELGSGIQTGEPNKVELKSYRSTNKLASYFARALYNYADRYYLNLSARLEGSSKFGPKAHPVLGRWGIFPALSGSWRISQEAFMADLPVVTDLKLRLGYGVTGNMPSAASPRDAYMNYLYLMRVGKTGSEIFINGQFIKPWGPLSNENQYLSWEKKHEYNLGIDFALGQRLSGTLDAYLRNTTDLLWEYNVPMPPYPYGTKWDNYGQLRNLGLELALNYTLIKRRDLQWNLGLTLAKNENRVIRITGGQYADNANYLDVGYISSGDGETGVTVMRLQEGQPIGNFYGFKYAGIKADGAWMFYTPSGGFTSSPAEADKQILGNAQPFATFGFNTAVNYQRWDLSLNFRGQFGGLIFNEMRYFYENTTGAENVLLSAVSAADKIAADRDASRLNANRRFSDFYLERATYLKLSDITLTYNIDLPPAAKRYITDLRLRLTAQNLLTLTGYSGIDPEVSMSGLTPGFDPRSYYPHQRTLLFGASMAF